MNTSIHVSHLTTAYKGKVALNDVSVDIHSGRITGIIGPNGAGKSTFMKSILDLITHSGEVTFNAQPIKAIRPKIGYVEQRASMALDFPIDVIGSVLLGTYPELGLIKRPGKAEKKRAMAALEAVNMAEYSKRQVSQLSGGQLQRVLIARVLVQDADWIFLDEPFVGIDAVSEKIIVDLLKELKAQGKTIVIVHHDLSKVTAYFDDLIILNHKLITSGTVDTTFTKQHMAEAYGEEFVGLAQSFNTTSD